MTCNSPLLLPFLPQILILHFTIPRGVTKSISFRTFLKNWKLLPVFTSQVVNFTLNFNSSHFYPWGIKTCYPFLHFSEKLELFTCFYPRDVRKNFTPNFNSSLFLTPGGVKESYPFLKFSENIKLFTFFTLQGVNIKVTSIPTFHFSYPPRCKNRVTLIWTFPFLNPRAVE